MTLRIGVLVALALLLHFPAEAQDGDTSAEAEAGAQIRDDRHAPLTLEPALIEKPSLKPGECDADTLRKLAAGRKGIDDGLASADQGIKDEERRLAELMEEENYIAVTISGLKDETRHIDAAIADNEASLRASIPPITAIKEAERLQRAKATNTSNLDYQVKLREANREELNAAQEKIRVLTELRAKTLADIAKHQTAMEALCTNAPPAKPAEPVTVELDNLPSLTDQDISGDAPCVGPQCLTVVGDSASGDSEKANQSENCAELSTSIGRFEASYRSALADEKGLTRRIPELEMAIEDKKKEIEVKAAQNARLVEAYKSLLATPPAREFATGVEKEETIGLSTGHTAVTDISYKGKGMGDYSLMENVREALGGIPYMLFGIETFLHERSDESERTQDRLSTLLQGIRDTGNALGQLGRQEEELEQQLSGERRGLANNAEDQEYLRRVLAESQESLAGLQQSGECP